MTYRRPRSSMAVAGLFVAALAVAPAGARPAAEAAQLDAVADVGQGVVEVAIRGARTTGWSDWHRIPAAGGTAYDTPVTQGQVRVRPAVPATAERSAGGGSGPAFPA